MKKYSYLFALAFFLMLAVVLSYPLVLHFSTSIPSTQNFDGDAPMFLWNTWWFRYSLFELHQNPYHASLLLYPQNPSLAFHTFVPINDILTVPFSLFLGPQASFNCMYLLTLTLNGFGMFCLAYRLTKSIPGSLFAGFVSAYSPAMTSWSLGHFNFVSGWMLPLFLLFFIKGMDGVVSRGEAAAGFPRKKYYSFALAGLLAAMQYWNDTTYFLYMFFLAIIVCGYYLIRFSKNILLSKLGIGIGMSVLLCAALAAPLIRMQVDALRQGDYLEKIGVEDVDYNSPDFAKIFLPSPLNPLFKELAPKFAEAMHIVRMNRIYIESIFVGFGLLILAVVGFVVSKSHEARGQRWLWLSIIALFGVGSLGPTLNFFGKITLTNLMPYRALLLVPFLNQLRVASRMMVVVYVGLGMLAAYGVAYLLSRKKGMILCMLCFTLCFLEFLPIPKQIRYVSASASIQQLGQEGIDPIFVVPFGATDGLRAVGSHPSGIQADQIWHHRPITNGTLSRLPKSIVDYYENNAALHPLMHPEEIASTNVSPQETALTLRAMGISTVVVYPSEFVSEVDAFLRPVAASISSDTKIIVYSLEQK